MSVVERAENSLPIVNISLWINRQKSDVNISVYDDLNKFPELKAVVDGVKKAFEDTGLG